MSRPPQALLRGRRDTLRGTVRRSPSTINTRHAVCRSMTARNRTSCKNAQYVCYIDRQKAHDPADRELLWTVVSRLVVPEKMLTIIRQFHASVWMTVTTRNAFMSLKACSKVVRCHRFYAAVIHAMLVRSREDPDGFQGFDPSRGGPWVERGEG